MYQGEMHSSLRSVFEGTRNEKIMGDSMVVYIGKNEFMLLTNFPFAIITLSLRNYSISPILKSKYFHK